MTTTTRARARHWPGFAQQELHRRISMIAVVFLGIHVLTSVLDTFVNISWAADRHPVHVELRAVLGRRGRDLAGPDDRRLRDQPAAGPDASRDVARHPLAGLPQLARSRSPTRSAWGPMPARAGSSCWAWCVSPPSALALAWRLRDGRSPGFGEDGPRSRSRSAPPKHLALTAPREARGIAVPSASEAPPRPRPATGCSAIRPTWRATSPPWVPSRCPRPASRGWRDAFVADARGLRPGWPGRGRLPGRHQARAWRTPVGPAAPSS